MISTLSRVYLLSQPLSCLGGRARLDTVCGNCVCVHFEGGVDSTVAVSLSLSLALNLSLSLLLCLSLSLCLSFALCLSLSLSLCLALRIILSLALSTSQAGVVRL